MKGQCSMRRVQYLFLLAWLISASIKFGVSGISLGTPSNTIKCIVKEREALLQFKQGIQIDRCGLLTSWDDHQDCCQWQGIRCDNRTGHVIRLQLPGDIIDDGCLEGKISPSLLELKYLRFLNLSWNNFYGEIPHQLAKLSSLTSLDLSANALYVTSLGWLSHLTLLRDLDLSYVILSLATDWMHNIHNLPFLRVLHMKRCGLSRPLVYMNISTGLRVLDLADNNFNDTSVFQWVFNLTEMGVHLEHLDLSGNRIQGPIPEAISNLKHLKFLDLSENNFQGNIPKSIGKLCSLQTLNLRSINLNEELSSIMHSLSGCAHKSLSSLDLGVNQVWGPIPDTISMFSSLRDLRLEYNKLNGTIGEILAQLSMLEVLEVSSNSLEGTISKDHLSNLSSLLYLSLGDNPQLVFNISANWIPPFQLKFIYLRSCKLGTNFPNWLLTLKNVFWLDISNTGIADTLPLSFWNSFSPDLYYLNVSHNNIYGAFPSLSITFHISSVNYSIIDFSSNQIEGATPSFLGNFSMVFLNNNMFSNPTALLCPKTKMLISYLDISSNLFSGQLPDCWKDFELLSILRLENNHFTGKLPTSIGALKSIKALYMQNNSFTGELPKSIENCTSLLLLDLAYNSLTGYLPLWIGSLKSLSILVLRSNKLNGPLPLSLCHLSYLQIMDLSFNSISGTIPKCIHNLTAMVNATDLLPMLDILLVDEGPYGNYDDSAMIMWKGKEQSFRHTLGLVKYIAISDNQLEGQIPSEISFLRGLGSLDLARNNLTGTIPSSIGQLSYLQLLNLSSNHLSGKIPTSLIDVSSLEILDLSNNDLSGRIPQGTQLRGFDPEAYTGNIGLCGPPLTKCPEDVPSTSPPEGDDIIKKEGNESGAILLGFYISAVLGFIVGFWGVCGSLVLKRSWRHAYFRFLYDMKDRLHVMVAVNIVNIWRKP